MAKTVANLTAVLQMNNTKFKKGVSSSKRSMKGLQSQVKAMGAAIAGAFAVRSVIRFSRESLKALDTQRKAEASLLTALKGREGVQKNLIHQPQNLFDAPILTSTFMVCEVVVNKSSMLES